MNSLLNIYTILLQTEGKFLFKYDKIFTVIAVIMIIWIGIVIFLLISVKKIGNLEKKVDQLKQDKNLKS